LIVATSRATVGGSVVVVVGATVVVVVVVGATVVVVVVVGATVVGAAVVVAGAAVVVAGAAEGPGLEQPIAMDPTSRATTRALTSRWERESVRLATSRSETIRSWPTDPRVARSDPHGKSEPGRYPLL
jgi:hypothetical protein